MKILYSINPTNCVLVGISLFSLLENNSGIDLEIFLLDDNSPQDQISLIREMVEKGNGTLSVFSTADFFTNIEHPSFDNPLFSKFSSVLASSIISSESKIIYLEANTIVDGSLAPLWATNMGSCVVAGIPDYLNHRYLENIGLRKGELYIDSGVMLLNLRLMREMRIENLFSDYLHANNFLAFHQEDILNAVIPNSDKLALPARYNVTTPFFLLKRKQLLRFQKLENYQVNGYEFNIAKLHPVIINYRESIFFRKDPWLPESKHPAAKWFNKYKSLSPWKHVSIPQSAKKLSNTIDNLVYSVLPKFLSLTILGDKYGRRTPLRQRKKILKAKDILKVSNK